MKLAISIKTEKLPPAEVVVSVETFRDVEKMGRKLAAFVKAASKVLPDLKDAVVEDVAIREAEGDGKKRKKARRSGSASTESAEG
jgi:hypothetical protein